MAPGAAAMAGLTRAHVVLLQLMSVYRSEIADDPGAYEAGRERARVENLRSVSEMSADYLDLYGDVMASRRRVGR